MASIPLGVAVIDAVSHVAGTCLAYSLMDEPWQEVGFVRRPKYGDLIQRFRPQWRVRLEKAIGQEILILATSAYVTAGVLRRSELKDVVQIYTGEPDGAHNLWRVLGYNSANEAAEHLRDSIGAYLDVGIQEWPQLAPTRLGTQSIRNRSLATKLTAGAIRLAQAAQTMVLHLQTEESGHTD